MREGEVQGLSSWDHGPLDLQTWMSCSSACEGRVPHAFAADALPLFMSCIERRGSVVAVHQVEGRNQWPDLPCAPAMAGINGCGSSERRRRPEYEYEAT